MAPQGPSARCTRSLVAAAVLAGLGLAAAAQDDAPYGAREGARAEDPAPAPASEDFDAAAAIQATPLEIALAGPAIPPGEPEAAAPDSALPSAAETVPATDLLDSATTVDTPAPVAEALAVGPPQPEPSLAADGIGNEGVLAMARAEFSESTILAAIAANPTSFDVSPRALVALKTGGVPESVIEAMLAAATAKQQAVAAAAAAAPPQSESAMPPDAFAKLSLMIEQLAAQQEATAATVAARATAPPAAAAAAAPTAAEPPAQPQTPRAWIAVDETKAEIPPTIAQVAFTDERGFGKRFKTLGGLAGQALAFVNPGFGGIASTLGGLFRSDEQEQTAVWALAGPSAARALDGGATFEVEFANIPGVDPDAYQPAIVKLVPTSDNYRLVAAAKTEGPSQASRPSGPIIEEPVATKLARIDRGRYRASGEAKLGPGEYALVLRPTTKNERGRQRHAETSLGQLLGGSTSQILYLTWDFAVR
jgi:hypothetical protein